MIADVIGVRYRLGLFAAALILGAPGAPLAHDLEGTRVTLTVERDGAFVLDVANHPDWLLLRLEPFVADLPQPIGPPPSDIRAPEARNARLAQLAPVMIDRVVLFVDGREVRPDSAQYLPPPADNEDTDTSFATYRMSGRFDRSAALLRWYYGLVVDPYPLTVTRAGGTSTTEWIGGDAWSGAIDLKHGVRRRRLEVVRQYLELGFTHILPKGLDHILFVLGIFLLSLRLRTIVTQVTTFTLAHSITLGLTMYGIVSLPPRVVEPLIAVSICYVAIENMFIARLTPWRLALVFTFGLLHGMGFAGVLQQLGLPRSDFLTALLSFNVGVEAGQLTVIAMAAACVWRYRHRPWYRRRIVIPASLAIAAVGGYWMVTRALGSGL
jgi:hypothetical protein